MPSQNSKKNILVTGGSGFIGAALVKALVARGNNVRVFDDGSRGHLRRLKEIEGKYEFVQGDIRHFEEVDKACKGMDQVIHLAFVNGTEFFYSKPELVLEVGVKGMIHVLDACIKNGIKDLVLASSSEVYQTPPSVPTDECVPMSIPDPLNPRYSYGGGKMISELLAINYGRKFFDRVLIFRPHNVYGPDMGWEHVLPQFAMRLDELNQKHPTGKLPFQIQGSGLETRSFVYIDDFTDGVLCMMDHGEHLGIYHIGTQDELNIRQVAEITAKAFNREIEIIEGALQKGGTPRRCPDIQKLSKLGYKPKFLFETGVLNLVHWYRENAPQLKPNSS